MDPETVAQAEKRAAEGRIVAREVPERPPEVQRALSVLEANAERLENRVGDLENRLGAYLTPADAERGLLDSTPAGVPMADRLDVVARALDYNIERLASILNRFEG